mgnify:CR=1 FL=1
MSLVFLSSIFKFVSLQSYSLKKLKMLESIAIKKLFGLFDYHIKFDTVENITILTGPNGYGKTTILNIIYHFFNRNSEYFQKLNFASITFYFQNQKTVELKKGEHNVFDDILQTKVYLIKEQRLIKPVLENIETDDKSGKNKKTFLNTIELYAEELKKLIEEKQLEAYQIAQKLDSSFPKRLIEAKTVVDEPIFKKRFAELKDKQSKLQQFGIATSAQEIPDYNVESAKVLSVYLNDSEEKLKIYDDLLAKIELFVNIINQKDFAFKSIKISSDKGFSFYQNKQRQELSLTDLSSGEQQEVVLLYELLFKTMPNTLILIDEPEISLHVLWQKAFIDDLQKIAAIKKINFLVSTHSPQIINNHWDLTRDLYDLSKTDENE